MPDAARAGERSELTPSTTDASISPTAGTKYRVSRGSPGVELPSDDEGPRIAD